jgi:hypothetical protein
MIRNALRVVSFVRARNQPALIWLSHDGSPVKGDWSVHELSGVDGVKHDLVALVDLDGDGDLDAITTEEVVYLIAADNSIGPKIR